MAFHHQCVLINGDPVGPIFSGRGLILCTEGLSSLLKKAESRGDIHGRKKNALEPQNIWGFLQSLVGRRKLFLASLKTSTFLWRMENAP